MQFPPGRASIYRLPQIKNVDQIPALVREIARERSIIAYTLVLPQYKEALEREAKKLNMATIDLLGPLIERISHVTGQIPLSQPGRLHILDESYFKRMEAVEFAIRYDDGKNPDGLAQADIILIGVSRTSKTPNCIYLAHHVFESFLPSKQDTSITPFHWQEPRGLCAYQVQLEVLYPNLLFDKRFLAKPKRLR